MDTREYFTCADRPGFLRWGLDVDAALVRACGLGVLDLPDADYSSMYEDGMNPAEAARDVLEAEGY